MKNITIKKTTKTKVITKSIMIRKSIKTTTNHENNMVIKTTKSRAIMKNILIKERINNNLLEKVKGDAHRCNDDECDELVVTTSHVKHYHQYHHCQTQKKK